MCLLNDQLKNPQPSNETSNDTWQPLMCYPKMQYLSQNKLFQDKNTSIFEFARKEWESNIFKTSF